MIDFPFKRIFGLIGAPRAGKDSVAQFLFETRNFEPMAFADKIKEEFGISKEDFEAAKIAGNIEELREALWDFSAERKKDDPLYFINLVVQDALASRQSVVITDIRTPEELKAVMKIGRVYWVSRNNCGEEDMDENGNIQGSKLNYEEVFEGKVNVIPRIIRPINNDSGLYNFLKHIDRYFFTEDIMDLSDSPSDTYYKQITRDKREAMVSYVEQFNIKSA